MSAPVWAFQIIWSRLSEPIAPGREDSMQRYDLVIIGSGPAGRRAAIQSAKLGGSVLVVDRGRELGGVSVHTGTIPSKTLRETVLNLSGWRERGFYGRGYRVKQEIGIEDLQDRGSGRLEPDGRGLRAAVKPRCPATPLERLELRRFRVGEALPHQEGHVRYEGGTLGGTRSIGSAVGHFYRALP